MRCLSQAVIWSFALLSTTGEDSFVVILFVDRFFLSIFVCLFVCSLLFDACLFVFLFNTTSRFRHTGLGSDPGAYPDYILALHSSKRLLAEQLSSSYHLLVQFISITIILFFIINKFPFLFAFQIILDTSYVRQNKSKERRPNDKSRCNK